MVRNPSRILDSLIPDPENLEKFYIWAFGFSSDAAKNRLDRMHAWNSLHSDRYQLTLDGDIRRDLEVMVALWKTEESS